ncbi:MAG: copper resistance protein B [Pseudomonadales bacterium]
MRVLPVFGSLIACLTLAATVCADEATHAGSHGADPTGEPSDWAMSHMMGNEPYAMLLVDRLEYGDGDHGDSFLWDLQGWYGGDYNKLWLKSEGEGPAGEAVDTAEFQALYSRLFTPFWSWQAGARYDARHGESDVGYAVLGLQGLAPQRFETDVALFVSDDGDVSLRGEFEYDLLLTQRLVLQPRLELGVSAQSAPDLGIGSGVTHSELGLRLRYEIRREFAPYLGIHWERLYGDTRDYAAQAGEPTSITSFVIGLRAWL